MPRLRIRRQPQYQPLIRNRQWIVSNPSTSYLITVIGTINQMILLGHILPIEILFLRYQQQIAYRQRGDNKYQR